MNKNKMLLSDIRAVTSGFISTFSGLKNEIDNLIHIKIKKIMNSKGYVSREDFHALEDRVNQLHAEINFMKKKK
tara:strand:- start:399 stop:620 length:222 start_codon:yes stop_codon:yes gene_type:complete